MKAINDYSISEIRDGFISYASNRRKNDKYAIGYYLDVVRNTSLYTLFNETYKRNELLDKLFEDIKDDNKFIKLLNSDYTQKGILNELNK